MQSWYPVELSYPGQQVKVTEALPNQADHYLKKNWNLPFIKPVGDFAKLVAELRELRNDIR